MVWLLNWIQIILAFVYPDVPQMSAQGLAALLEQGQVPILLDARRYEEYRVSHLPQAQWAPRDLEGHALSPRPIDQPVVIYCSVGVRSTKMARRLRRQGINAVNLAGSIFQWAIEQRPLAGPGAERGWVHPYNDLWGILLPPRHRAPAHFRAVVNTESETP